jgi:hypothetical protein
MLSLVESRCEVCGGHGGRDDELAITHMQWNQVKGKACGLKDVLTNI